MTVRPFTIAVDYDGTLSYPEPGDIDKEAVRILRDLVETGPARIILLTMREGELLDAAVSNSMAHGLAFWSHNRNPDQIYWEPARKVYADAYVDDHNVFIPKRSDGSLDWGKIGRELKRMMINYYASLMP